MKKNRLLKKYFDQINLSGLRLSEKITIWHILLFSLCFISLSAAVNRGGIPNTENYYYLPESLSKKPLFSLLFSPVFDSLPRPRQLSFFFDIFDAYFIAACVRLGIPHFLSITHYIFSSLIGLFSYTFFTKDLKINKLFSILLVVLFYTSSTVLFGYYFRTAKVGVALSVVILIILAYRSFSLDQKANQSKKLFLWMGIFLSTAAGALFDEQGLYIDGLIFVGAIVLTIATWDEKRFISLSAITASLIICLIYYFVIYPRLYYSINQEIPLQLYLKGISFNLQMGVENLVQGWLLFIDTIRFLYGNLTRFQVYVFLFPICITSSIAAGQETKDKNGVGRFFPFILLLWFILGAWVMNATMVYQHPPLVWPDIRRVYYWFPIIAMVTTLLPILIRPLFVYKHNHKNRFIMITIILLILIGGNIYAIPEINFILRTGHLRDSYTNSPEILEGLKNLNNASYFPSQSVINDGIYQYFKTQNIFP